MHVVLLTFIDTAPHHYTRVQTTTPATPGTITLTPGDSSYTLDDFSRKFGVTGTSFGDNNGEVISLDGGETLPLSYGSLRDYFHEISVGALDFTVRLLNKEDPDNSGYPEWIIMDEDRQHYEDRGAGDSFLEDALEDAVEYVDDEYADDADYANFPRTLTTSNTDVVVFVYAGFERNNRIGEESDLHPHAIMDGCCYVTGERQGSGRGPRDHDNNSSTPRIPDSAETFTGIGIHAHEMGHVLGLRHPHGDPPNRVATDDRNVYAGQTPGVDTYTDADGNTVTVEPWGGGTIAGWCTMQSGADGPPTEGRHVGQSAYTYSYDSCPNPFNPFYMDDMRDEFGWNIRFNEIDETSQHYRINPMPEDYYVIEARGSTLMLELRDAESFGRYNLWYQFDEAPGLLVWKRPGAFGRLRLVPADRRRIFNAMAQPVGGQTRRLWSDDIDFIYPWMDLISDPFGAIQEVSTGDNLVEANGLRATILSMKEYQGDESENVAALPDYMQLFGSQHRVTPGWATDATHFTNPPRRTQRTEIPMRVALRNISVHRGTEENERDDYFILNVFHDYWEGTLARHEVWDEDVTYVGGDLIIPEDTRLSIEDGTEVRFLKPRHTDTNRNGISEIIVQSMGTLNIGTGVTFASAHERKNESDDEAMDREDESHGLIVESGGQVTIDGLTVASGDHYMYAHSGGTLLLRGDLQVNTNANARLHFTRSDGTDDAVTIQIENGRDFSMGGDHADKVEIIVDDGASLIARGDTFEPRTEPTPASSGGAIASVWYGIRNVNGTVDLTNASMSHGEKCVSGPATVTGAQFENCNLKPEAPRFVRSGSGTEVQVLPSTDNSSMITRVWVQVSSVAIGATSPVVWHVGNSETWQSYGAGVSGEVTVGWPAASGRDYTMEARMENQYGLGPRGSFAVRTPPEPPPAPTISHVYQTDSGQMQVRILVSDGGGRRVQMALVKVSSTSAAGDDFQWLWGGDSSWERFNVHYRDDTGSPWTNPPGQLLAWAAVPYRDYTMQAQVGRCHPERDCSGDGEVKPTAPIDERKYIWSEVISYPLSTVPPGGLTVGGPEEVTFYDDWDRAIGRYTVHFGDGAVASGAQFSMDDNRFRMETNGDLTWESMPAFDVSSGNLFDVNLTATLGPRTSPAYGVQVTLKRNSPGTLDVTNSDPPRVRKAMVATVTDLDNAVDPEGDWFRVLTDGTELEVASDTMTYRPGEEDVGFPIRVEVTYRDDHSDNESVEHTTPAVVHPPGRITLSPNPPKTCAHLEATLTDGDGGINTEFSDSPPGFAYGWRWIPQSSRTPATTTTTQSYLPGNSLVGQTIRVTVQYGDNASDRNTAATTSGVVQANVPRTPTGLRSTPGAGRVSLAWTAPNDCGSTITGYSYQYRKVSESTWLGSGTTTGPSVEITGLDNDVAYRFEIRGVNAQGESAAATQDETPGTDPPVVDPPDGTVRFEHADPPRVRRMVTAILTDDDNPRSITWAWQRVPSAGAPTPLADTDNTYTPVAADVGHALRATATYTDDDGPGQTATATTPAVVHPPGTITLSPDPPSTCAHVEATLTDADGGINTEFSDSPPGFAYGWSWIPQSSRPPSATTTTQSYLPGNSLVGQTIRVTVQYGDNASDRNTAARTSGAVQANVPRTPTGLRSTPGAGRVSLAWTAPNDCGSTITGYSYRYRKVSESAWLGSGTTTGPAVEITGLESDVAYRFEIKAVNAQGESAAATRDETPETDPPVVDPPDGTVRFEHADPPRVRRMVTAILTDDDNPRSITWAWQRVPSAGAPTPLADTDNTYTPVAADVGHRLRATATYTDDDGPGQTATATTPAVVHPPGRITLSPNRRALTWRPPLRMRTAGSIPSLPTRHRGSLTVGGGFRRALARRRRPPRPRAISLAIRWWARRSA